MKRSLVIFAAVLITAACGTDALAQNGVVSLDGITNSLGASALSAGSTHIVSVRYNFLGNPTSPLSHWYGSNGFEIYSPDGADWVSFTGTRGPLVNQLGAGVSKFNKYFNYDGTNWTVTGNNGADAAGGSTGPFSRAGFSLATFDAQGTDGYEGGLDNDISLIFQFQSRMADEGKTICFDTCAAITAWEWSNGEEDFPAWDNGLGVDGPRCWVIGVCPNCCPQWCMGNEGNLSFGYCHSPSYSLCALPACQYLPVEYRLMPPYNNGDYGSVDAQSGQWTWPNPQLAPGSSVDIKFLADGDSYNLFTLHVTSTTNGCDCCVARTGDANGSGEDEPTVGDISTLIDHLFISGAWLNCIEEADVNQSGGATPYADDITIGDVSALIDYLFITGPQEGALPACM